MTLLVAKELSTRDFDTEYVGKYKDQKAYAYFDSGFVGESIAAYTRS